MHKVFISYHHVNDQPYKDRFLSINAQHQIFLDQSVDTGDIDDNLSDEAIREKIRDEYLRDSTVTVVLVGTETNNRKHVDWEIYSSMYDGKVNKKSGILVLNLPTANSTYYTAPHAKEKETVYPENTEWISVDSRAEFERRYPLMPARIIDNLLKSNAIISIASWTKIASDPDNLAFLIDAAYKDRASCEYDLSRPMRRADS